MNMEEKLRANAELVRKVAEDELEVTVDYDKDGVAWLDEYIDEQREIAEDDIKNRLPNTLGSFLGECIRHSFGGEWVHDPEAGWAVKISDKLSAYPFNKVRKQLNSADGESVLSFFKTIPALLRR